MGTGTGSGNDTQVKSKRGIKPKKGMKCCKQTGNWVKVGMEQKRQKTKYHSFISFVFGVMQERCWMVADSVRDDIWRTNEDTCNHMTCRQDENRPTALLDP